MPNAHMRTLMNSALFEAKNYTRQLLKLSRASYRLAKLAATDRDYIFDFLHQVETQAYFSKYIPTPHAGVENGQPRAGQNKIWELWLQGEDAAPEIVKTCLKSVRKFSTGQEITVLSQKTIAAHILLPGYIYDKKNNGSISDAHFSDVLRACLLVEHGGTWIDSTVLLTDTIPKIMLRSPLSGFSTNPEALALGRCGKLLASSWFIHAMPKHVIMSAVKDLLFEYWKHENDVRNYFAFH